MKKNWWKGILLIFSSTLLGVLLSNYAKVITNQIFDNPTKTIYFCTIIILLISILSISVFIYFSKSTNDSIIETHNAFNETSKEIIRYFNDYKKRLGLSVRFIIYDKEKPEENTFTNARNLVREAIYEILVLDYHPSNEHNRYYDASDTLKQARKEYYDELVDKAKNGICYKRIIQFPESSTTTIRCSQIQDQVFTDHCRKILEIQNAPIESSPSLKSSSIYLPQTTFVIIDKKIILWEIVVETQDDSLRLAGDLIFIDHSGGFSEPLLKLFERIDNEATQITQVVP
ncbi:MAG: hypothetical protein AB9891_15430 [Anaerolineaceae bacterium]